jgi:hypothetical protein
MESFPSGRYRDQVDAASGAFNRLALGPTYPQIAPSSPSPSMIGELLPTEHVDAQSKASKAAIAD